MDTSQAIKAENTELRDICAETNKALAQRLIKDRTLITAILDMYSAAQYTDDQYCYIIPVKLVDSVAKLAGSLSKETGNE